MASSPVPFKPHFGAFILETLTVGMYGESRNAIREYIQNSFDALRQAIREGLVSQDNARVDITLSADRNALTLRDNGVGLRTENAVAVLASVGASNKDFRRNAGFRGIGRLAGIVFSDRITFETKARGQAQKTIVVFKAKELRALMSPEAGTKGDAAEVLESCVEARQEDVAAGEVEKHYFAVELRGFTNPPAECKDVATLKSFIGQVSPLRYDNAFPFAAEIRGKAEAAGFPIEEVRIFFKDGDQGVEEEIFKPYGADFLVQRERIKLTGVDEVISPTGKWWGWVGRKRHSGAFKDEDSRGLRVRVRNIQIGDARIVRDIFAISYLKENKPRSSYARFAEWYVGEIFIKPEDAVPNARRDGFEEDEDWKKIRNELDTLVATRYGKLAYKTSQSGQLSVESITKRHDEWKEDAETLIQNQVADWDRVSLSAAEGVELQRRINKAVKAADDDELPTLRALSEMVTSTKRDLDKLVKEAPAAHDCTEEIDKALADLTQQLYSELQRRLGPTEWANARTIIQEITLEEPA